MKIVFTGGGTGGHFYPVVAIAEKCVDIIEQEKIVDAKLYFFAPSPYNRKILFENGIRFRRVYAGKMRRHFSLLAPIEFLKTAIGVLKAIVSLWVVFPDVVFGKGGYGSFPTLLAAKFLRIPVIIHESDSIPGRANLWAGKFADRIALSYVEAASYFDKGKTAYTGQPVRKEVANPAINGAHEYLNLKEGIPVILILGGSQGAQTINEIILDALPELLKNYQVIHQTGNNNLKDVLETSDVILEKNPNKDRYKAFGYLNDLAMRMSAGTASLVISRAGSTIFEIAAWSLPSIIIPIADSNGDHQSKNAFNYARTGASVVIEEKNLSPHLLLSEIERIMGNKSEQEKMKAAAHEFYHPDAAQKIAREIVSIALAHEK
ncbi:MAG: UDP-N-acetylglucosamine--N-acetylmuramyl-(pentapeptide) pyrophosphoryl-undecaprenol N-acetylglucosamine transferase [Candidatus Paceibacterota bacterium]|jgi:UDP-N-acetylglucosamine--N-acetylmuramyl-(pentapeptide) pyrophosphoryl-undecaprenol N-acetylglucosamine transferase